MSTFWFYFKDAALVLGALGTFGAFFALFFKDRNKQRQIDQLSNIARDTSRHAEVAERYLRQLSSPYLTFEMQRCEPTLRKILVRNSGKAVEIISIETSTDDFHPGSAEHRRYIVPEKPAVVELTYRGDPSECYQEIGIKMVVENIQGYRYEYKLSCGHDVYIDAKKDITDQEKG